METMQKSGIDLHLKTLIGRWTGHNDSLEGGAGHDRYRFTGNFGHDTITDSDDDGAILIGTEGQTLRGQYVGIGKRNGYALNLGSGKYAGLAVYEDARSTTGHRAIITLGTDANNTITINNFNLNAAQTDQGYLGIKLDPTQRLVISADNSSNVFADLNFDVSSLAGKTSNFIERAGKTFTISLSQAAAEGSKLILNIAGAVSDKLKAILGDSTVDANGAEITLTEGQTTVSFSLVSDSEITADQLGSISAQYQTDSNDPNNSAGNTSVSSNTWGLTLKDAGTPDSTLRGDYAVKVDTTDTSGTGYTRIIRTHADGQIITVWREGEQRYFLDGQNNLIADAAGELVTDNVISGNAGNDKIEGLTGSDLLSGGQGNDQIDGGEGADMIGGGSGADRILGGDGDDYISSSAGIVTDHQNITSTDTWNTYGLPAGKTAIVTQARWGVYEETEADGSKVQIWSGIGPTRTDTAATEGDVVDAGAGNDHVIGSWAADRIKGGTGDDDIDGLAGDDIIEGNEGDDDLIGDGITKAGYLSSVDAASHGKDFIDGGEGKDTIDGQGGADQLFGGNGDDSIYGDSSVASSNAYAVSLQYHGDDYLDGEADKDSLHLLFTTNSIANYAEYMPAKCSKRLKNRRESSKPHFSHRKCKPYQHVAAIDTAQSAIEFVVNRGVA